MSNSNFKKLNQLHFELKVHLKKNQPKWFIVDAYISNARTEFFESLKSKDPTKFAIAYEKLYSRISDLEQVLRK